MQAFEYANPTTLAGGPGPARRQVGRSRCAGRRHRPDQPDEGVSRRRPSAWSTSRASRSWAGFSKSPKADCASARRSRLTNCWRTPTSPQELSGADRGGARHSEPADPQHGDRGRRSLPAAALLVLPPGLRPAGMKDGKALVPDGENRYHAILGNEDRRISSARRAWARR